MLDMAVGKGVRGRGQTSVDFAIAMGLFLVVVTTVFAFAPTLVAPFQGSQEDPLVADRLVVQVADQQIAGDDPGTLDETCTMYFFNGSGGDPCATFDGGDPYHEKLSVGANDRVNVTLRANISGSADLELLCRDGAGVQWSGCTSSGDPMAVGPDTGNVNSMTISKRTALFTDRQVYVVVRVWE